MKHLILSELTRFRTPAIVFAVVHLIVLRASVWIYPLFEEDAAKTSLGVLSYALLGLLFGFYQMSSYRRPDLWAWLIHRPLPMGKIFLSLTTAAALLALAVVFLPALVMTLYTDFLTGQWVDSRHYLAAPFLFGFVMSFYALGTFMAAGATRWAPLVGVLPLFFLTREAVGQWIFVPLLVVMLWLGFLAFACFRPHLGASLDGWASRLAAALPIGYAALFMLSFGVVLARSSFIIVQEEGPLGFSTFAWNDYWDAGYLPHVQYLDANDALAHGLRMSDDERAQELLAQLPLTDVFELLGPRFARFPRRHQPFFVDHRHELVDGEREIRWTFSHDQMLFHGTGLRSGQPVGRMGVDGAVHPIAGGEPVEFDDIPLVVANRWWVTPRQIRHLDLERQVADLRFELPDGEVFTTPFTEHRSFVVATSQSATQSTLYFFDPLELELGTGPMEPKLSVTLPDVQRNVSRVLIAEMVDSYVVSVVAGAQSERGYHDAFQRTVELPIGLTDGGGDAEAQVLVDAPLAQGFPAWYRHRRFLMSPVLQHLHDVVWSTIGPYRETRVTPRDLIRKPLPAAMWGVALLLALMSAVSTHRWASSRHLDVKDRRFWVALAFLLGVPGLVAFAVLARRQEGPEVAQVESSSRAVSLSLLPQQEGWTP